MLLRRKLLRFKSIARTPADYPWISHFIWHAKWQIQDGRRAHGLPRRRSPSGFLIDLRPILRFYYGLKEKTTPFETSRLDIWFLSNLLFRRQSQCNVIIKYKLITQDLIHNITVYPNGVDQRLFSLGHSPNMILYEIPVPLRCVVIYLPIMWFLRPCKSYAQLGRSRVYMRL